MTPYVHARLQPGRDDDLIEWLESQIEGSRSEAIRALLRDGLRAQKTEAVLRQVVRQAVDDALRNVQFLKEDDTYLSNSAEPEIKYGRKLDGLLGGL